MQDLLSININYWILQTVAMLITIFLIPKLWVDSPFGALLAVIALAFVNTKVWNTALFFEIPNTISYHSVLLFLTNGLIFWILVKLLPGIQVEGFLPALIAPIVFTVTSILISKYGGIVDWMHMLDQVINYLHNLKEFFQNNAPEQVNHVLPAHK